MKKTILISAFFVAIATVALAGDPPTKKLNPKTGTYGVCNCGGVNENSVRVELTINEDNTFSYFDNSNPSKKIDTKGTWTIDNNAVILKDQDPGTSIQTKWAIDENEKCLKSRKGLSSTRLCHLKSCN